jgi:hypothetical protein
MLWFNIAEILYSELLPPSWYTSLTEIKYGCLGPWTFLRLKLLNYSAKVAVSYTSSFIPLKKPSAFMPPSTNNPSPK